MADLIAFDRGDLDRHPFQVLYADWNDSQNWPSVFGRGPHKARSLIDLMREATLTRRFSQF
jgi:hypothetical protein